MTRETTLAIPQRYVREARAQAAYMQRVGTDQAEAGRDGTARDYFEAARMLSRLASYIARVSGQE